jgi:hypothetical protein
MAEQKTNIALSRHRSDTKPAAQITPMGTTLRTAFRNAKVEFLYFVRCRDFVKIGRSTRPYDRLSTMQTCNPYPLELVGLVVGGEPEELELHRRLADYRERAEWFRVVDGVADVIERVSGIQDPEFAREVLGFWWRKRYETDALLAPPRSTPIEDIDR